MTIISKGEYRLQTISAITKDGCKDMPISL